MARREQFFTGTACLVLKGPKAIIPEALIVQARLDRTWNQLLTEDLHLPVTDSGIFVCSSRYNLSSPKEGEGWRSELNDKIGEFVGKFTKGEKKYIVRLCHSGNNFAPQENSIHGEDARYGAHQSTSLTVNHDQTPGRGRKRVKAPTPGAEVSRDIALSRLTTPSSATPVPSTSSASCIQSRGPAIVIPTRQGAVPITPRTGSKSLQENGSYERPRYVHGIPPFPNDDREYSEAWKRRFGEISMTNNMDSGTENVQKVKQARRHAPSVIPRYQMQQQVLIQKKSEQSMQVPNPSVLQTQDVRPDVKKEGAGEEEQDEVKGGEEEEEEEWSRNWDEEPKEPVARRDDNDDELSHDIPMIEFNDGGDNSAGNNNRLCTATAIAVEEEEPVPLIKPKAEDRLHERFSNSFLLSVKAEIADLRRNNTWERNVKRGPTCCYFLTELFKD